MNYFKECKRRKYRLSYEQFWREKGEYGINRILSTIKRKQKRWQKRKDNMRYNHFHCEMGYSSCEERGYCNGDC